MFRYCSLTIIYLISFSCIKKGTSEYENIFINSNSNIWDIEDVYGGCFLINYKGSEKNIIIPENVDNKKVLGIKGRIIKTSDKTQDLSVFGDLQKSSEIKTVDFSLAKYIREIGMFTFLRCENIKKIILNNNIQTINDGAFMFCKNLDSLYLPNSINKLGIEIFWGCNSLKYINLSSNINEIPRNTFAYCNSLKTINIHNNIRSIGSGAFMFCYNINNINITDKIDTLFSYTFYNCLYLNNIVIPTSVKNISNSCFEGCKNLNSIHIKRNSNPLTSFDDLVFKNTPLKNSTGTIYIPKGSNYKNILINKVNSSVIFTEI